MNKFKIIALLFAATALTASVSAQTVEEVTAKYNEAGAAYQAKDFAKAATLFEEAIQQGAEAGPDAQQIVNQSQTLYLACLMQQGLAMATQQNYTGAIEMFTQTRDRAELYGNAQIMRQAAQRLGQVYFVSGADAYNNERYEEAIGIFSQGFAADDTNTDMGLNLARSYDKVGNLDKAVETYNKIIALESRHSRYAEAAATAKEELGLAILAKASEAATADNTDEVLRLTALAIEADSTNTMASMMRLQTVNNLKNYAAVIEYGEATAEAQTDEALKSDAYFMLGAAYQNQGNTAKAIEAFRKVTAGNSAAQAKSLITELSK
ncbi:MAG: tetratricopeptide repeat protein [Rikenellaceae bacterium]|nr:tetratricopeptide repeat protein [Rikenellaceae bacterium]